MSILIETRREAEARAKRECLIRAVTACDGNLLAARKVLGISQATIYRDLHHAGFRPPYSKLEHVAHRLPKVLDFEHPTRDSLSEGQHYREVRFGWKVEIIKVDFHRECVTIRAKHSARCHRIFRIPEFCKRFELINEKVTADPRSNTP